MLTKREQRNLFVINSLVTVQRNIYWVVTLGCILVLTAPCVTPAPAAAQYLWLPQVRAVAIPGLAPHSPAPGGHCLCQGDTLGLSLVPRTPLSWWLWRSLLTPGPVLMMMLTVCRQRGQTREGPGWQQGLHTAWPRCLGHGCGWWPVLPPGVRQNVPCWETQRRGQGARNAAMLVPNEGSDKTGTNSSH